MRLIVARRLLEFAKAHREAAGALATWGRIAQKAKWANLPDVRKDFSSADGVRVGSGRIVTVFNIRGNKYRLLTAIHFNRRAVYILRFLTHAECDKEQWKGQL